MAVMTAEERSKTISERQTAYWAKIKQLAQEQNLTVRQAQKLYKDNAGDIEDLSPATPASTPASTKPRPKNGRRKKGRKQTATRRAQKTRRLTDDNILQEVASDAAQLSQSLRTLQNTLDLKGFRDPLEAVDKLSCALAIFRD